MTEKRERSLPNTLLAYKLAVKYVPLFDVSVEFSFSITRYVAKTKGASHILCLAAFFFSSSPRREAGAFKEVLT